VLFQPFYNIFMNVSMLNAVATGIATETVGMTSGAISYVWRKQVDLPIGFIMIMLTIPGVVVGNHALLIINGNVLKLVLGIIIFGLASVQLMGAIQKTFGKRDKVPVEEIYGKMWIPPIAGFFSATTGTGIAEITQPTLEKSLGLQTKKANATAIMVEATGDWVITILNLHAGLIKWEIWIFAGAGVIIGGQIGPAIAKYLPERLIKMIFSVAVIIVAVFYVFQGSKWIAKYFGIL
jgi:uncharacterized protein